MTRDFNDIVDSVQRVSRRNVEPTAVRSGMISDVVAVTNVALATTTLNNGEQAVFTTTVTSYGEAELMAEVYTAFYIDTEDSAHELPGGTSIDESQWQVIGSYHPYNSWDASEDISKVSFYIRNISAGASKTVIYRARTKYFRPAGSNV